MKAKPTKKDIAKFIEDGNENDAIFATTAIGLGPFFKREIFEIEILGFDELTYFVLQKEGKVWWLASMEEEFVRFPVLDLKPMGFSGDLGILTIPSDMSKMTVNLRAPIVLKDNKGRQVTMEGGSVTHPIYEELKAFLIKE